MLEETIPKIFDELKKLSIDMAVVKTTLKGNGQEGLCRKVERHDKYFYKLTGAWIVISVLTIIIAKIW